MSSLCIIYVSRDKEFAHALTEALQARGIKTEDGRLGLGDSLSVKVRQGLQEATYAVLILSEAFFDKSWPRFEFEELDKLDRNFEGGTKLLPIWHNIDPQRVSYFAPELAQRMGVSTSRHNLEMIVEEIAEVAHEDSSESASPAASESVPFQKGFSQEPIIQQTHISPQVALRENLNAYFSETELRVLCFDLGIEYENLGGRSKPEKILELIGMMQRHGRLEQLIALVRQQRPFVNW
ncbi:MAG: TIR domain-containing protein [Chloroflexota bacterium]